MHIYEVRPRKDGGGAELIGGASRLVACDMVSRTAITNPVGYANFYSRSIDTVIRLYERARHGQKCEK
jgi:hypothetical protein